MKHKHADLIRRLKGYENAMKSQKQAYEEGILSDAIKVIEGISDPYRIKPKEKKPER